MTSEPKRKLAYSVFARSEATKQSQFHAVRDNSEIVCLTVIGQAAIIRQEADFLAMTAGRGIGLILNSLGTPTVRITL